MIDQTPSPTESASLQELPQQHRSVMARFELRRPLGQGAESQVWLAFDPRLGREVTIKFVDIGMDQSANAISQWLHRMRSTSHLVHPHIVAVLEVDVQDGQLFQIGEYVPGKTLAALLLERETLAPARAVALAIDMLDALVLAHGAAIVHGSLTADDILVDFQGRARVMDFGFPSWPRQQAAVAAAQGENDLAPEALQGKPATALTDVYSVGRVLARMLWGRTRLAAMVRSDGLDTARPTSPLLAPDSLIDDGLRAIVEGALAGNPAHRPSARALHERLLAWSAAGTGLAAAITRHSGDSDPALQVLMQRMQDNSDFPAMSHAVARIMGMASSETESVGTVAGEILKDVALANKLLRMVNSAYYSRAGTIATVSRAVSLVGFNGIRNMALGLVLLERMQDKVHAQQLIEEFMRSLMAASIARELSPVVVDGEEAFIGAMFQDLGRLLAKYYFPQEAASIRALTRLKAAPLTEEHASIQVLGLSFEALGLAVADAWDLPEDIRRHMRHPVGEPPTRVPTDAQARLRWVTVAANQIADTLLRWDPALHEARLEPVYKRYCRVIGCTPEQMQQATVAASAKLADLVSVMELRIASGSATDRLLHAATPLTGRDAGDSMQAQLEVALAGTGPGAGLNRAADEMLAAGIADITQAMVDHVNLSDVVRMVVETVYRAKGFDHVIFCMLDPRADALTGRFGLGEGVGTMVRGFHVPLGSGASDLFHMVCAKGADTLIADATVARVAQRLPAWYHRLINAPTFLLLPLLLKDKPFGLIYADMSSKDALILNEKELAMLRTLRNQAVMAFQQSH